MTNNDRCTATIQPFCRIFLTLILTLMGLLIIIVGWCVAATRSAQAQCQEAVQQQQVFEAQQDEAGIRIQQSLDHITEELQYQRALLEARD